MPGRAGKLIALRLVLLLCLTALPLRAEPVLRQTANVIWDRGDSWFGGLSGAEITDDGAVLTLVGDRGTVLQARMRREGGALTGLRLLSQSTLRDAQGRPLRPVLRDAEGLAATGGRMFVSFENAHRVMRLDPSNGRTHPLPTHPDFADFGVNSGLEALAAHPDGRLFAIPERSGARDRPFALYAFGDDRWQVVARLPRRGPFLPVGADFDDSGRLYLLERAVTPLGFRSRIRRFDPARPGFDEKRLLLSGPGRYDNLEAIALWRTPDGTQMMTLVSDDNFLSIQRTQIVEFAVDN